ncbi:MAG: ornithine carbamoyltransferase [Calditrichaeota bacterium]|nr:ornithine carbamoyltransferase [Calditrichota bacterium]
MSNQPRDFLNLTDLTRADLLHLLHHAVHLKDRTRSGECPTPLSGEEAALIFHKPSLRTRLSFEVGIRQLGGNAMFITDREIELGKRETTADVARVLSRFAQLIVIRTFKQSDVVELAHYAPVPVINALTDLEHPCQIFCDLLTIFEKLQTVEGLKIAYLGDGNNVARSWIGAANRLDIDLWVGTRPETDPGSDFVEAMTDGARGRITITDDPLAAARGADVLYTDVWASMGEKEKVGERASLLEPYRLDERLLEAASPHCLVMHCLPAERGREITDGVIEGPHSVVFDQAENRLHGQKSLILWCLGRA